MSLWAGSIVEYEGGGGGGDNRLFFLDWNFYIFSLSCKSVHDMMLVSHHQGPAANSVGIMYDFIPLSAGPLHTFVSNHNFTLYTI